ncbi:MAG TPA: CorA family divalent cation transporter, partial [Oceanipulchritudo sp.]|nr:CorA family divalent cation transporter [Oceanipulchritudo sp.]
TFLRDVQDHAMQVIDLLEGYRETASSLNDLYQSSVGNRMNEIMKVLTIMASFFIPITFVAGVYGMNFAYIPELEWRYSYFVFWGICLLATGSLAYYFWRRGWIGRDT